MLPKCVFRIVILVNMEDVLHLTHVNVMMDILERSVKQCVLWTSMVQTALFRVIARTMQFAATLMVLAIVLLGGRENRVELHVIKHLMVIIVNKNACA